MVDNGKTSRGVTYKTLEQAFSSNGATWYDIPDLILQLVELQCISHFLWFHG